MLFHVRQHWISLMPYGKTSWLHEISWSHRVILQNLYLLVGTGVTQSLGQHGAIPGDPSFIGSLRSYLLYYTLSFIKLAHSLDPLLLISSKLTNSRSRYVHSIRATLWGIPSFSSLVSIPTGGEGHSQQANWPSAICTRCFLRSTSLYINPQLSMSPYPSGGL